MSTRNPNIKILFILITLFFTSACVLTSPTLETGRLDRIADGDSFQLILSGSREKIQIRLYGIDAPERGQAHAQKAKNFTKTLLERKELEIDIIEEDDFGRWVANVYLPDGRLANQEIVAAGYAWWFKRYAPHDTTLSRLEQDARNKRLGLWKDKKPIPPWEYRYRRRNK